MGKIILEDGIVTYISDTDGRLLSKFHWRYDKTLKHVVTDLSVGYGKSKTLKIGNLIMQPPKGMYILHLNGENLDNRRENLRIVNKAESEASRPPYKTNTSGFKGVSFHKLSRKWRAKIRYKNKNIYLGEFNDIISAAKAYNDAAMKYHGEYGYLNDIEGIDRKYLFQLRYARDGQKSGKYAEK
jgi:hypothetical protein